MIPTKTGGPAVPTQNATSVLRPLEHDRTTLTDTGWLGQWQHRNAAATLPHVLSHIRDGNARSNLARLVSTTDTTVSTKAGEGAGVDADTPYVGLPFTDSDVYKTLEAVGWQAPNLSLDDPTIAAARDLVALLQAAQEPDGYLNSRVQGDPGLGRYTDPQWGHELYCAGHLFQAAVAAERTGSLPGLIGVATRFADHLVRQFGAPQADVYVEGHPEVETALVELFRLTGTRDYLDLAARQLQQRGHGWLGDGLFGSAYFQDHVPVRDGAPATGHAVRQLYLLTGSVDVAVETNDEDLLNAAIATWDDLAAGKTYLTGAHGSRHRDEAIGDPFELPADRAYAETCAAIASFQLCWRLLLATGEVRYADEMERVLYNAIAGSTSDDGRAFFYSNPLHLRTDHVGTEDAPNERLSWYWCPCCPPNLARLLASIHDYVATTTDQGVQLHHPVDGTVRADLVEGPARIQVTTAYPWDGGIELDIDCAHSTPWELAVRVPSWCSDVGVWVDGRRAEATVEDGYLRLRQSWQRQAAAEPATITPDTGEPGVTADQQVRTVRMELAMPVRRITPHPRIDAARGCVAVARGPLLYAIEDADLPDEVILEDVQLVQVGDVNSLERPVTVELDVQHRPAGAPLYRSDGIESNVVNTQEADDSGVAHALTVHAHPYFSWGNRAPGAMRVWIPVADDSTTRG